MRAALGAVRGDFIGLGGGALGLGVAYFGRELLTRITPHEIPRLGDDRIDFTVLCFAAVVSILASMMFGLAPAFQSLKPDLQDHSKRAVEERQEIRIVDTGFEELWWLPKSRSQSCS